MAEAPRSYRGRLTGCAGSTQLRLGLDESGGEAEPVLRDAQFLRSLTQLAVDDLIDGPAGRPARSTAAGTKTSHD